jgi:hypothetical protein
VSVPPPNSPALAAAPVAARPGPNVARIIWIVLGALAVVSGASMASLPVSAGLSGANLNLGMAILLSVAINLVLLGIYLAGIFLGRRDATGRLRAVPPGVAFGILVVLVLAVSFVSTGFGPRG